MVFAKFNGLLTYSQGDDAKGFSITARAYHGKWNSSDQIPVTATPDVGFFGTLNPTDGGNSARYSLQTEWHREREKSKTKITLYGFYYDLDLFSDFTYYLDDPIKGDQFEQRDKRFVLDWTRTMRLPANGSAARWKTRSECSSATIGCTTAFTGRKIARARTRMMLTHATTNPSTHAIPIRTWWRSCPRTRM